MTVAIYPGRFDPVTAGHLNIVQRAARLFDRLIVAVLEAPEQQTLFTTAERVELLREAAADVPDLEVQSFGGLVVDYAHEVGAAVIVRHFA